MINFSKVEQSVRVLKEQLAAGNIDQQSFEARLMNMIDIAADGYYWMYGHETEQWYRHDGQQWIAEDPGKLRMLTPSDNSLTENAQSNNPHHPKSAASSAKPSLSEAWRSLNWGWFIASVACLIVIGWIVYASV